MFWAVDFRLFSRHSDFISSGIKPRDVWTTHTRMFSLVWTNYLVREHESCASKLLLHPNIRISEYCTEFLDSCLHPCLSVPSGQSAQLRKESALQVWRHTCYSRREFQGFCLWHPLMALGSREKPANEHLLQDIFLKDSHDPKLQFLLTYHIWVTFSGC